MSMRNYAVTGYGVVLNGIVNSDKLEELVDENKIETTCAFTGETFAIDDKGFTNWGSGTFYDDETLYYVGLPRHPHLFHAAYLDMRELVSDMTKAYRKIGGLPKIDDIRKHIRYFSGTYYG